MDRLTREQIGALDPYTFLAVLGKRVIHPSGRASTGAPAMCCPSYVRKIAWLMPRMSRALPYLGHIVVHASKPRVAADAPVVG